MRLSNWPLPPKKHEVKVHDLCSSSPALHLAHHRHQTTPTAPPTPPPNRSQAANQIAKMLYSHAHATEARNTQKTERKTKKSTERLAEVNGVRFCVGMKNNVSVFTKACVELCMCEREFIHTLGSVEWDRTACQVLMWWTSASQAEKPVEPLFL